MDVLATLEQHPEAIKVIVSIGILILIVPRLLNIIVAVYLIVVGLMGLFPGLINLSGGG